MKKLSIPIPSKNILPLCMIDFVNIDLIKKILKTKQEKLKRKSFQN
jgi:hypothetical protein